MPRWLYSFIIAVAIALAPALTAAQSEPKEFADSLRGGPDFWEVTSLAAGETLKMREAPSLHAKTGMQVLRGTVLKNHGCTAVRGQRWCKVELADEPSMRGWVNGRYLRESAGPKQTPPGRLL